MSGFAGFGAARSDHGLTAFARDARGRVTVVAAFPPRPVRRTTVRSSALLRARSGFGGRRRGTDRGMRSRPRLLWRRGGAIRGSRSWGRRARRPGGPGGCPAAGRPRADRSIGGARRSYMRRRLRLAGGGPGSPMICALREGKAGQMAPAEGTGHQGNQPSRDQRGAEDDHGPNQNAAPSALGDEHGSLSLHGTLSKPRGRAGSLRGRRICRVGLHIDQTWTGARSQPLYRAELLRDRDFSRAIASWRPWSDIERAFASGYDPELSPPGPHGLARLRTFRTQSWNTPSCLNSVRSSRTAQCSQMRSSAMRKMWTC
jgi:hypothetical protein